MTTAQWMMIDDGDGCRSSKIPFAVVGRQGRKIVDVIFCDWMMWMMYG
jgi:hypothetical protein